MSQWYLWDGHMDRKRIMITCLMCDKWILIPRKISQCCSFIVRVNVLACTQSKKKTFKKSRVTLYTAGQLHTAVPHCSHSRAPGEQWARLYVFTLQGCVQAARLCRGSPVKIKPSGADTWNILGELSVPWLLMLWFVPSPSHQQQWTCLIWGINQYACTSF